MDQLGNRNPFWLPAPIAHLCKIVSYRICQWHAYVTVADTWRGSRICVRDKGRFGSLHIQYMLNVLIPTELQALGEAQCLIVRKLMRDSCLASFAQESSCVRLEIRKGDRTSAVFTLKWRETLSLERRHDLNALNPLCTF